MCFVGPEAYVILRLFWKINFEAFVVYAIQTALGVLTPTSSCARNHKTKARAAGLNHPGDNANELSWTASRGS